MGLNGNMAEFLYGDRFPRFISFLIQQALNKGGSADDWQTAYDKLQAVQTFVNFDGQISKHNDIVIGNLLQRFYNLVHNPDERERTNEALSSVLKVSE